MKIYIPSETYTGKPIIYLDDGEKEIIISGSGRFAWSMIRYLDLDKLRDVFIR